MCVPIDPNWNLDGVSLIPNCSGTIIGEIESPKKKLIKISDVLGRFSSFKTSTFLFYIYDDGSVEKRYIR